MLQSAMKVLQLFGEGRRELGMADVSRLVRRPATTVSRWLRAMADAGFLERDRSTGRYRVGSALLAVASRADQGSALQRAGRAALERLTAATGETTYLGVLQGSSAVLVDGVMSPRPIRLAFTIGERVALHASATGKCLLAWQPEATVRQLLTDPLPPATHATIARVDALLVELATTRVRGFATARAEWEDDLAAVAAPVRDSRAEVVAALSVGGPLSRFGESRLRELGQLVVANAERASAELGWAPRPDAPSYIGSSADGP